MNLFFEAGAPEERDGAVWAGSRIRIFHTELRQDLCSAEVTPNGVHKLPQLSCGVSGSVRCGC